jgi:hypothetical protein
MSEYQFGQYECRAENNLGHNSAYIDIQQSKKSMEFLYKTIIDFYLLSFKEY